MSKKTGKKPQGKKRKTKWSNRLKDMYRWKFLRQNPDYELFFKRWVSLRETGKFLEGTEGFALEYGEQGDINIIDETLENINVTDEKLDDCKSYFCRYWGISSPTDPKLPNLPPAVFFLVNKLKPIVYEGSVDFGMREHSEAICKRIEQLSSYVHYYPSPFKILVLDLRKCNAKDIKLAKYKKEFYKKQKSLGTYLSDERIKSSDSKTIGIKVSWDFEDDKEYNKNPRQRKTLNAHILNRTLDVYKEYLQMKEEHLFSDSAIYSKIALSNLRRYKKKNNNPKNDPRAFWNQVKDDVNRAKLLIKTAPFIKL